MKLLLTVLLAILFVTQASTGCLEKVGEVREKFQSLEKPERRVFATKVAKKLMEKYPNASKRSVLVFTVSLFSPAPPARVCKLYKKFFKQETVKQVEEKPKCQKVVAKIRGKFQELETREEKKQFLKKVFSRLTQKYPEVAKAKIAFFMKNLLSENVPAKKVCALRRRIFKKPAVVAVEEDKPKCQEVVAKIRTKFQELETKEEKKKFLKKFYTRLSEKFPDAKRRSVLLVVGAVLSKRVSAKKACALKRRLLKKPETVVQSKFVDEKPKCRKVVKKIRGRFAELETKEEKKAFVKTVFERLSERFPEAGKKKVFVFIRVMLSRAPARLVCKLRRKLFRSEQEETKSIIDEVETGVVVDEEPTGLIFAQRN